MPKVQHPVRSAVKTRAVDDVSNSLLDGLEKGEVILRIVFKVGILDDDDVALRDVESCAQGRSLAPVPVMKQDPNLVVRGRKRRAGFPVGTGTDVSCTSCDLLQ